MGQALDETPDFDLPDPGSAPSEWPILVEEARIGCMTGMLLCLDRQARGIRRPGPSGFTKGRLARVSDVALDRLNELELLDR
jgi:hypothetical protein